MVSMHAARDWKQLSDTPFFERSTAAGTLVGTREVDAPDGATGVWETVLEHDRVPFVSYPYEWTFGMLRAAAIAHLELLLAALEDGFTTKDGYAYNVQFRGATPVFIDIGSFAPIGDGGPWVGYRQFCQTMLYPLMLESYLGVPFNGVLRGQLEGIEPGDMRRLLGPTSALRKGVLRHVMVHDLLAERVEQSSQETRKELASQGAGVELSRAIAAKLLELVRSLTSKRSESAWADYRITCSYSDEDTLAKRQFVDATLADRRPSLVFDLGCNDGAFSRIAATHSDEVVAVDFDPLVVDNLFRELRHRAVRGASCPGPRSERPRHRRAAQARSRSARRSSIETARTWCWRWRSCTTSPSGRTSRVPRSWTSWSRWVASSSWSSSSRMTRWPSDSCRTSPRAPTTTTEPTSSSACSPSGARSSPPSRSPGRVDGSTPPDREADGSVGERWRMTGQMASR